MLNLLSRERGIAMLLQKFSKDSKRGFVVGANDMTPEKLAAGAVTLSSALIISAIGGLIKLPRKKPHRAKGRYHKEKKKAPLWALAMPIVFKAAKSAFQQKSLDGIAAKFVPEAPAPEPDGIEVIDAIPISSEEEVYEYV